ncbi:hypothetical protein [Nitrosomonas communis]|uniref:Uncharacterized protein n=1 Tax=Nitrosomonas communis TaxID=44574 RepID=A0A1I4WN58_9PROT|nr:hypothetical protein [Nitrosomonas communis]SFN14429.1 hypothetical protein SAMN05421863_11137 [Nitrosomonas communis]
MQLGFFGLDSQYAQLTKLKAPLEELNRIIDWNLFAELLAKTTTSRGKVQRGANPLIG